MDFDSRYDEMFLEADQLIANQQIKSALELLLQIIEEQPDYGRAHNHLGWIYEYKLRAFDKAENHYRAALHFSPDYPAPWLNYAYFLSNLRRYDELEKHLSNCLKVPGVYISTIYNEYGVLYEMKEDYQKAINNYEKAIKYTLDAKDIDAYKKSIERAKEKLHQNDEYE